MKRICCVCRKMEGDIEPLDDVRLTHGYCSPCLSAVISKFLSGHEGASAPDQAPKPFAMNILK